jgi:hypothetical protein
MSLIILQVSALVGESPSRSFETFSVFDDVDFVGELPRRFKVSLPS